MLPFSDNFVVKDDFFKKHFIYFRHDGDLISL